MVSKTFEFADLVGMQITNVGVETGAGADDCAYLDISDGAQVQMTGNPGTLIMVHGELEELCDREVVCAIQTKATLGSDIDTFILTVAQKSDASSESLTPAITGYHTVIFQFLTGEPFSTDVMVERKE